MDTAEFICSEIEKTNDRNPRVERSCIWICCPYHGGGNERVPSMRIQLYDTKYPAGDAYCFGCKKRTNYNEIAVTLGLAPIKAATVVHGKASFSFSSLIEDINIGGTSTLKRIWRDSIEWPDSDWRGIQPQTLHRYDAKLITRHSEPELFLPVLRGTTLLGGIYCKISINQEDKQRGIKAYINADGAWSQHTVFGYNQAKRASGPLIVVEGPRDTLKVSQCGGRVVGLLGSAITDGKIAMIETIDAPYVIILTDPDNAGDLAAKSLAKCLDRSGTKYIRIRLPEGTDPADLTITRFNKVLEKAAVAVEEDYG